MSLDERERQAERETHTHTQRERERETERSSRAESESKTSMILYVRGDDFAVIEKSIREENTRRTYEKKMLTLI